MPQGRAYIYSTFNNTLVSITDPQGNVIASASAGVVGFKGSRKGTAFAAQRAAEQAGRRAGEAGMRHIDVFIKGPGAGREAAIRSLQGAGLVVTSIRDVTTLSRITGAVHPSEGECKPSYLWADTQVRPVDCAGAPAKNCF